MARLHATKDAEPPVPALDEATGETEAGTGRPLTVTLAALITYILGAACLARGAGDPSATDGTGASGIGLIVLGVVELSLVTLALPGRALARACLLLVLVLGGVIIVVDQGQPAWFRVIAIVLALAVTVLMSLVRPSRTWFGDDASPLVPTSQGHE